ncbi:unnamed protein product [Nesidiocoris tenuis]|uniref:Uncharacterized protein n=1 Tax=Nesidiocoris tenuis TaxID=355587 RepID=A0A6H5GSH1_9HEMI|nr:unnamed protein product [Nesidiocoris tenuis]
MHYVPNFGTPQAILRPHLLPADALDRRPKERRAKRSTEETGIGADGFIAEDPRQSINLVVEDDAEVRELAEVRISDDAKQSGPLKPPTTEYGAFRRPGMIGRTPQYNRLQGPSQGMGLKADPYDRPEGRLASL